METPEKKSHTSWLGALLVVAGVVLFSTIELASKEVARATVGAGLARIDGYALVFLRFLVTGVILTLWGLHEFHHAGKRFCWKDWGILGLNGLVGIAVSIVLFHFGIDAFENASSAAVVFSANALFTIILARFMNGEAWTLRKWVAVLIGMCGISCFICERGVPTVDSLGAIAVMSLSALSFAFSVCLTRRHVARYGASLMMGASSIIGSLLVLPIVLCTSEAAVLTSMQAAWLPLSYLVIIGTLVSYLLYYEGVRRITAYAASMIFLLKPVLACIIAVTIFGEHMNVWTISGAVIIISSLLFAVINPHKKL